MRPLRLAIALSKAARGRDFLRCSLFRHDLKAEALSRNLHRLALSVG